MKEIISFLLKVLIVVLGSFIFYNIVRYPNYAVVIFPTFSILIISSYLLKDIFLEIVVLFVIVLSGVFISLLLYNDNAPYSPFLDKIIILIETGWMMGCFYFLQKIDEKVNQKRTAYLEKKESLQEKFSSLTFAQQRTKEEIYNNSIQIKNYGLIEKIADKLSSIVSLKDLKMFVEKEFQTFFLGQTDIKLLLEPPEEGIEKKIVEEVTKNNKYLYINNSETIKNLLQDENKNLIRSIICIPLIENVNKNSQANYLLISSTQSLSEDFLRITMLLSKYVLLNIANIKLIEITKELSITDSLTGLYVQKYLKEILQEEINRAKFYEKKLSIAMIDLDNFKKINDTYGHNTGDDVLVCISNILKSRLRETDIISRYGGDEFCVILPDTNKENAFKVMEDIREIANREEVFARDIKNGKNKKVKFNVSCGVKEYEKNYTVEEFLDLVDKNLYKAKSLGKNKTVI